MKIARVTSDKRGEIDCLISETATRLESKGATLAGIVKVLRAPETLEENCDMNVRVLPDGPVISITQSLGKGSTSCRLNPAAIAEAVSAVEARELDGIELFVLNKFGPEESAGRGFCAMIGAAVERDIPVLVGVGGASREAFDAFAGGLADEVHPDVDSIEAWCANAMKR